MSLQQDWLLRQIENVILVVAKILLKKDDIQYEIKDETNLTSSDLLYRKLKALLAENKICEAEDLLYERLNSEDQTLLHVALDFYDTLNQMSDEQLQKGNFSRKEVSDGLQDFMEKFGIALP